MASEFSQEIIIIIIISARATWERRALSGAAADAVNTH